MSDNDIELPHAELMPWHQSAWQQIVARKKTDRLPHAILLNGPEGLGKSNLAAYVTQALVCKSPVNNAEPCGVCDSCHLAGSKAHPDVHWVMPEAEGKAIKIDAIRQLSQKSVLAAQGEQYRVFIVSPADAMNVASSNALLKTLEEPTAQTLIILVSGRKEKLPATIRSRCQEISVAVPNKDELTAWIGDDVAANELQALMAVTANSPLRIRTAIEENWLERASNVIAHLDALKQRKTNPMRVREDWQNLEPIAVLADLERCLADMIRLAASNEVAHLFYPLSRATLQSLVKGINLQQLYQFQDTLYKLKLQLNNNLNMTMLLEKLIIDWLQLSRSGAR